jgi:hypothetical protein
MERGLKKTSLNAWEGQMVINIPIPENGRILICEETVLKYFAWRDK